VAGVSAACAEDAPGSDPLAVVDPSGAAVTSFPDLDAPTGEPGQEGLAAVRPEPGSVGVVPGPFDDRFTLDGMRVARGVVTGRLTVTSDVSDLLELEVVAGFYDAAGELIGTSSWVHHLDESAEHGHTGPPDESVSFRIVAPPALRERVTSAAVGVPVLVNE